VLQAAIQILPDDARRIFAGSTRDINRAVVEPDGLNPVPAEACKHWIDVEKLDPAYLAALEARLTAAFGTDGWADEDARLEDTAVATARFGSDPPPWAEPRLAPLWSALPPTIEAFRQAHGRMELFTGSIVWQPFLYARAFARAVAAGDRRRAIRTAGWLAHYTADLTMPLHVSSNYRGQFTRNLIFSDKERGDVHARFETGYLKERLAEISAEVKKARRKPAPLTAAGIFPLCLETARATCSRIPAILEADRAAVAAADPRRDWERYVGAVDAGFHRPAAEQLELAIDLVARLLLSAQTPSFLGNPAASGKMEER